uniref:Uncharacterized protein n=1 Tax=Meloidogyne incognita TaxID=6306 RepID=A0A914NEA5_MELIC
MDHHDCQTTTDKISRVPQRAICELRRYCCAPRDKTIDRQRRNNLGCNMGDFPTGSRCDPQRPKCFAGEYCGNQAICCLRSSYDRRRPPSPYPSDDYPDYSVGNQRAPAFCYNSQQTIVSCTSSEDCKQLTQACVNGLCCTRTGDEWKSKKFWTYLTRSIRKFPLTLSNFISTHSCCDELENGDVERRRRRPF